MKREVRIMGHGRITKMAEADNYVMVRRPHCMPFVLASKEWDALPLEKASILAREEYAKATGR